MGWIKDKGSFPQFKEGGKVPKEGGKVLKGSIQDKSKKIRKNTQIGVPKKTSPRFPIEPIGSAVSSKVGKLLQGDKQGSKKKMKKGKRAGSRFIK